MAILNSAKMRAITIFTILAAFFCFSASDAQAQSMPSDVTAVCNLFNSATKKAKSGTQEGMMAAVKDLMKLGQYTKSTARLNSASRDALFKALSNLSTTFYSLGGETFSAQEKEELRQELNVTPTLGEIVSEFYEGFIGEF